MAESSEPEEKEAAGECTISEEEIDETLKESFPASDPPQWTLGVDRHAGPDVESQEKDGSEDESR